MQYKSGGIVGAFFAMALNVFCAMIWGVILIYCIITAKSTFGYVFAVILAFLWGWITPIWIIGAVWWFWSIARADKIDWSKKD
jgi:hypothetical protein